MVFFFYMQLNENNSIFHFVVLHFAIKTHLFLSFSASFAWLSGQNIWFCLHSPSPAHTHKLTKMLSLFACLFLCYKLLYFIAGLYFLHCGVMDSTLDPKYLQFVAGMFLKDLMILLSCKAYTELILSSFKEYESIYYFFFVCNI